MLEKLFAIIHCENISTNNTRTNILCYHCPKDMQHSRYLVHSPFLPTIIWTTSSYTLLQGIISVNWLLFTIGHCTALVAYTYLFPLLLISQEVITWQFYIFSCVIEQVTIIVGVLSRLEQCQKQSKIKLLGLTWKTWQPYYDGKC